MNIYVGNISFDADDDDLRELFEEYGEVESAKVIKYRNSGRSKGFGFVEMVEDEEAENAISELDQSTHMERPIKVEKAKPREDKV